jgi:ABC-type uncharacterized transport system permease subunit
MNKLILLASVAYLLSSGLLLARLKGYRFDLARVIVIISASLATAIHGILLWGTLIDESGIHIGLGLSLSLATWLSAILVIASSLTKPMESLGIIVFPLSLLGLWLPAWLPAPHILEAGIGLHVIMSLIAFTLIGLAAAQAALLMVQEKRLRDRQWQGLVGALPPLVLMEKTLFEWLFAGFIMLSFALVTGALFVENLLGQHLAHKTVFSIMAWVLLASLLWGHHKLGWRGQRAARITLWGYGLLVLGYAGSQFILEVILA